MALKIGKRTTRKSTTEAVEPLDFGKTHTHTFTTELEVIPKPEWEAMFQGETKVTDTQILRRTLKNIEGLTDESDQPIPFNDSLKDAILEAPWLVSALIDEQLAIQSGKTSAEYKRLKLKNS